jgi:tetratricopeptide (TPR) repeat protein
VRTRLPWIFVLVCILAVICPRAAYAGDPLARPMKREAREHLDKGNKLYNIRSFDEAITEFKAGALIEPAPVFDYNLGQAYRQLGKYQDALWHYDRFMKYGEPTGELRDAVTSFMAAMRAHIANRALTMPPTAAAPPERATDQATLAKTRPTIPESTTHTRDVEPIRPAARHDGPDWIGWSLAGSGVVALGVSGVLLYSASRLNGRANTELDARARDDLHDQASTRNTTGIVIGVGGLVLTAVGVIKLAVHPRHPASNTAALDVGITSNGVFVLGHF